MESQSIQFASKTENLTLIESLVDGICDDFKIHKDHYGNILVALTEAVTNAIQHGNKYDLQKQVDVSMKTENDVLSFLIKDEGQGFDFSDLPDPTSPENLEKPHGRGIFLMQNLADEVDFQDDGRCVQIHFKVLPN